jgi:SAM-dependent methyltransferase
MNDARCPICHHQELAPFLRRGGYQIVRCERCGFLFVCPPPTEDELAAFYQDPGYYCGSALGYQDYFAQRPLHEREARRRLRRIERLLLGRGRILDVGAAAGFFLKVAQERGWAVHGVELSAEMRRSAAELTGRPLAPRLADLDPPPGSFDAATMWEYIEHIPNPRAEIERLAALLRPGGILALSTPNTRYWTAVHQPERWREFKPPAHVGFFTEATLWELLSACGLEVVAVPRVFARAPRHPYAADRLLALLREHVGNGADRRTPLWWTFSLAWRVVERGSQLGYALRWPESEVHVGLEAYARKL